MRLVIADLVLVRRLQSVYWSEWLQGLTLVRVLSAEPLEFVHETTRAACYGEAYDAGRVHYLLRQIRRGETLEPVEIDTCWSHGVPAGVALTDGHHRFVAHVLARKRRMPASVGGLVSVIEWLTGKRRQNPLEA